MTRFASTGNRHRSSHPPNSLPRNYWPRCRPRFGSRASRDNQVDALADQPEPEHQRNDDDDLISVRVDPCSGRGQKRLALFATIQLSWASSTISGAHLRCRDLNLPTTLSSSTTT